MSSGLQAEAYDGTAELAIGDGQPIDVTVRLRAHFEPIDGRLHWYGRVARTDAIGSNASGSEAVLTTPIGKATGRLSDQDPWGRFRIAGLGEAPF